MHRIVQVAGKNLILGLEWIKLSSDSKYMKEAKELATSRKASSGVVWSVALQDAEGNSETYNRSVGLSTLKTKGVTYSGGAAFSKCQSDAIGIEQIEEDLFWLIVVDSGKVLPGYDCLVSSAELKAKFQELSSEIHLDYMVFCMEDEVAERFEISGDFPGSPLNLISNAGIDESMRLKGLASVPKTAYYGIAAIVLLGGMFFLYKENEAKKLREWEMMMLEEEEQERRRKEEASRNVLSQYTVSDADLLRTARDEEIQWLAAEFQRFNKIETMRNLLFIAKNYPRYYRGWQVKGFMFSARDPVINAAQWQRDYGSPNDLDAVFNAVAKTTFTPDFASAMVIFENKTAAQSFDNIMSIIDNGVRSPQLASLLLYEGFKFASDLSEKTERKEPIKGLKDKTNEKRNQLDLNPRNFSIEGVGLKSYEKLMNLIEPIDNFLLSRISIKATNRTSFDWRIEGKLYE